MSTASTKGVWDEIRDRLLSFTPPGGGAPLSQKLVDLYYESAPDDVTMGDKPYGVMRFTGQREGEDGDHREVMFLELTFYGRPRGKALTVVSACADLADQALFKWVSTTDGGPTFTGPRTRASLPLFGEPADRDVAAVRLLYRIVSWPKYLALMS